jgi:hypothetical protein
LNIEIDHILVAAPDLEGGRDYAESIFGTRPVIGGVHPGQGTRNALLGLEDDTYIEVIAPDPAQPADLPLSRYLASRSSVQLSWWCARCDELEALQDTIRDAGLDAGSIDPWSRKRPDGEHLSWQLLMPNVPELGAALPFFISWDDMAQHPSRHVPVVGRLETLTIRHPRADVLGSLLGAAADIRTDATPGLSAEIGDVGSRQALHTEAAFPPAIGEIIRQGA